MQVIVPDAAADGLVAYYTFDDNAALDSSGNGHHATAIPLAGPGYGPSGSGLVPVATRSSLMAQSRVPTLLLQGSI